MNVESILNDFSRSQAVMHTIKVVIPWNQCTTETLLLQITNTSVMWPIKRRHLRWPWVTFKVIHLLQAFSNEAFHRAEQQLSSTDADNSIFRPHRNTTYVDAAYSYWPSSVVCRSVILVSPAKTAAPIELPFRLRTWLGPGNHVLDGGPDPPWEGANFWWRMVVPL